MHSLAISNNGKVFSWGCNDDRVLGRDGNETEPGLVELDAPVDLLTAGDTHSIVANSYKSIVYLWGNYRY